MAVHRCGQTSLYISCQCWHKPCAHLIALCDLFEENSTTTQHQQRKDESPCQPVGFNHIDRNQETLGMSGVGFPCTTCQGRLVQVTDKPSVMSVPELCSQGVLKHNTSAALELQPNDGNAALIHCNLPLEPSLKPFSARVKYSMDINKELKRSRPGRNQQYSKHPKTLDQYRLRSVKAPYMSKQG